MTDRAQPGETIVRTPVTAAAALALSALTSAEAAEPARPVDPRLVSLTNDQMIGIAATATRVKSAKKKRHR